MSEQTTPQRVRVVVPYRLYDGATYERVEDADTGQEVTGIAALGLSLAAYLEGQDETCLARMEDGSLRRLNVVELVEK